MLESLEFEYLTRLFAFNKLAAIILTQNRATINFKHLFIFIFIKIIKLNILKIF